MKYALWKYPIHFLAYGFGTARFQEALANYGNIALRAFSEVAQGLDNDTLLRENRPGTRTGFPRGT